MVCDICGEQDALIHVQQIMGGEVLDIHLCTDCAREKGIPGEDDNEDRLSLNNLLSGIVENFIGMQGKNTLPACPRCATRVNEIKKNKTAGCADCYVHFRGVVGKILKQSTEDIRHKGSIPKKLQAYKAILIDKEILKKKLKEAVHKENYEMAAMLRDRILDLESNPGGSDG